MEKSETEVPDCETCRRRIADYTVILVDGGRLVNLGRATCQECGGKYTAYAERSDD